MVLSQKIINSIVRVTSQTIKYNLTLPFIPGEVGDSVGTGFFINNEGVILTCYHNIEHYISIWVSIPPTGQKKYNCSVLGVYPELDIAVLKIHGYNNRSYLELGNSDDISTGEEVTAAGYPLNSSSIKMSKGIVSGRNNGDIQTDTPLNPGNSGGPLLRDSKVIGINFQIASGIKKDIAIQNIGFAIPINAFKNVVSLLVRKIGSSFKENNIVYKPSFGLYFNTTSSDLQKLLECPKKVKGVYVRKIVPTSSLYNSELKEGDILCAINEYNIDNYGFTNVSWNMEKVLFPSLINNRFKVGDVVTIEYWCSKNKEKLSFDHKIQPTNKIYNVVNLIYPFVPIQYVCFAGLVIMELSINHLLSRDFESLKYVIQNEMTYKKMLVITQVLPGSNIYRFDIFESGDFIYSLNKKKVNTICQFRKMCLKLIVDCIKNKKKGEPYRCPLIIKSKNKKKVVLDIYDVIKEDKFLQEKYKYKSLISMLV